MRHSWLIVLLITALLVAACGPEVAPPTASDEAETVDRPTAAPTNAPVAESPTNTPTTESPTKAQGAEPTATPNLPTETAIDPDDWRALGAPDAPVTIVEYVDFQ